jgi:hypothetical protein
MEAVWTFETSATFYENETTQRNIQEGYRLQGKTTYKLWSFSLCDLLYFFVDI